jgi:hypothetical protein
MRHGLEPGDFRHTNRRSEARTPLARRVDIMACEGSHAWAFVGAELTDCSPRGLALISAHPLPIDSEFLVKLKVAGSVKLLVYTVQTCQPCERGRHRIGARFKGWSADDACNDPAQIMAALLAHP